MATIPSDARPALLSLLVALCAGCGSPPSDPPPDAFVAPTDAPAPGEDGGTPAVFEVEFTTTAGTFVVEAHRDWAPLGVDRFYELVRAGYYDGNRFFRVIAGFVVQFGIHGDPATTAMWDRAIPDDPVVESNVRGTVAFATAGPNTRTTQLFLSTGENTHLDGLGFAPIGRITSGMSVVSAITDEYGEMPDQSRITSEGNAYLDASFPNLDAIVTARIR